MSKRRAWTDEELAFLQEKADWGPSRIGRELGRSRSEVSRKRIQVTSGWTPQVQHWTEAENETILAAGPYVTAKQIAERLPGRNEKAVAAQSKKLGRVSLASHYKRPDQIGARPLIAKTCVTCGKLLPADWFQWLDRKSGWRGKCKKCHSENTMATRVTKREYDAEERKRYGDKYIAKCQDITVPHAEHKSEPFTDSDHEILRDPDMTLIQKALILKRTFMGIRSACAKFGYKSHVGLGDPERDKWMIDNPNADRLDEIRAAQQSDPDLVDAGRPDWDWDD